MTSQEIIEACRVLLEDNDEALTEWERGFVRTMQRTGALTERQREVFTALLDRLHISRGLTCAEEDLW